VFDRFSLADLSIRVLAAPMAGGLSTPELAAAVSNAGGLGFLAGDLSSAEELADAILAARKLTSGAVGVNLLVPQQAVANEDQLSAFESALAPEAERYGVPVGEPCHDDEWDAKLEPIECFWCGRAAQRENTGGCLPAAVPALRPCTRRRGFPRCTGRRVPKYCF
jgi:nitronate monooxygenase